MARRTVSPPRLQRWLLGAAVLHAAMLFFIARVQRTPAPVAAPPPADSFEITLSAPDEVPLGEIDRHFTDARSEPATANEKPAQNVERPTAPLRSKPMAASVGAPSLEADGKPALGGTLSGGDRVEVTSAGLAASDSAALVASKAQGASAVSNGESSPTLPTPNVIPGPAVSAAPNLAALGYGTPHAAALSPYLKQDPTAAAQDRLSRNFAQGLLNQDRDRSMGIEGPITRALSDSALAYVQPDSLTRVAVLIGADGKLADFRIIESNHEVRTLTDFGAKVKLALASQTIRVPAGRAVEFTYELKSEVLYPSGRAPGFGVDLFGLNVKKKPKPKSGGITLLKPELGISTPPPRPDLERNGEVELLPPSLKIGVTIFGVNADLVDIGSAARQVIHARLLKQRVL